MSLNPRREALGRAASEALRRESPFRVEAEAQLGAFRARRAELEQQIRRGQVTPTVAREALGGAAAELAERLRAAARGFHAVPPVLQTRLAEALDRRRRAREVQSLESLQRETNRLLRQSLIEQELVNRTPEFEARAFVRPLSGGPAAPTLEGLLNFHREATDGDDAAAQEWARRQLEALRKTVHDEAQLQQIDRACNRPDQVNPRLVSGYLEVLRTADEAERERFVAEALAAADASACCAAFALAREVAGSHLTPWGRQLLDRLAEFPDAALKNLNTWENEARLAETEAALAWAEYASAQAAAEARLDGIEAPSEAELRRQQRLERTGSPDPNTPVGLTPQRRGVAGPSASSGLQSTAPLGEAPAAGI